MYNFVVQAYSSYKGLFYWLNWMSYISNVFLYPVAQVIIFALLGRFTGSPEIAQAYALGLSVFLMASIQISGLTQSYNYERQLGTLSFIYVSRVNRIVNFMSRPLLHYPNALFTFTFGLTTAWVITGLDFGSVNWVGFVVAVLVTGASMACYAQFAGMFAIVYREWFNTQALTMGALFVLTGVIIPIAVFPTTIQEIVKFLPLTNGILAVRAAFSGTLFSEVSGYILREFLTGLGYLTVSLAGFLLFERVVKRTGVLNLEA